MQRAGLPGLPFFFASPKGIHFSVQTHNKLLHWAALIYQHTYTSCTFSWSDRSAQVSATPFPNYNLASIAAAY
jgi:hypothetical protein